MLNHLIHMARSVRFMFRLTEQEFIRLKNNARVRDFATVAGFLRAVSLDRDLWLEKKVQEIFLLVKEINNSVKKD